MTTYTWDKQIQIDNAITTLDTLGDTSTTNASNAEFIAVFPLFTFYDKAWRQHLILS
jgi:hypothetical protein